MPELAEVETVINTLKYQLGNVKIIGCKMLYSKLSEMNMEQFIVNQTIRNYTRYGKYLIFELDDYIWITHLRMEGKFYIVDPNELIDKHIHAIFDLDNGLQLRYHDTRKFGRMYIYPKNNDLKSYPCFKNVGLDLFDKQLTPTYIYDEFSKRKYTLKQALLDQSIIAGIGNIYSDEICYALQLHPLCKANTLTMNQCEELLKVSKEILTNAIKAGGTTIRSYTSSLKVDGRFQLQLKVHSKKGEKCQACGNEIIKIKVGGRGTYVCDKCQKIQ